MESLHLFFATGTWWAVLLVVLAAGGIAWMTYRRTTPALSARSRSGLTILRWVGITMLALALFEPVLRAVTSFEEAPQILVAIDESRSLSLKDGKGARLPQRNEVVERVREAASERWSFVGFDESVRPLADTDSLRADGERTDLSRVLQWAANRSAQERPPVVLFITDGQYNSGESPVSAAAAAGIGVYAIGIGDTTTPADLTVTGMLTGEITVVRSPTPVSVAFEHSGLPPGKAVIRLLEEDREVARDTIEIRSPSGRTTVDLQWTPSVVGKRKLTAVVETSGTEATTVNNRTQRFVDVRSSERIVSLIAGAPSPDVSFVTTVLESDPNIKVRSFIQKQGSQFYGASPSASSIAGSELCVLIGFPIASTPSSAIAEVATALKRGAGVLFIPSRDVAYDRLGPLEPYLPFSVAASRPVEFKTTPDVQRGQTSDPILKVTGTDGDQELWNTLPPIVRTETFVTPRPGAKTLATIKVNNVPLPEPLLIKQETEGRRSLAVLGYGLYRWELQGEGPRASRGEQPTDVFRSFIGNATGWLAVRDDERRVVIRTSRDFYSAGESVSVQATVLNESMQPVDQADVRVRITGPAGERDVILASLGTGRYRSVLGTLPPGEYRFSGTAVRNGRSLGADQGRFSVGDLSVEDAAITMNTGVLRTLASTTGGAFGTSATVDKVLEQLRSDPRLRTVARTTGRDTTLWHTIWPLMVALAAF